MSKAKYFDIIRYPVVTEKSTIIGEFNKYVFEVEKSASKNEIKHAVSHVFGVKVKTVNTICVKGKIKKYKGREGKRNDYKKAIITLEPGQTIDIAAEV